MTIAASEFSRVQAKINLETPSAAERTQFLPDRAESPRGDHDTREAPADKERHILDKKALDAANKRLVPTGRRLEHLIHDKTNKVFVRVVDTKTDEVIREIPTEESLDYYAKMLDLAGLIIDSEAK
ncbi:MAG: flagellar protein FlaG [Clostridiales bacterium]|jgi:flagellar protein FlaG|nr:flagellar protein FlaG [Clostridiales bacterium]